MLVETLELCGTNQICRQGPGTGGGQNTEGERLRDPEAAHRVWRWTPRAEGLGSEGWEQRREDDNAYMP